MASSPSDQTSSSSCADGTPAWPAMSARSVRMRLTSAPAVFDGASGTLFGTPEILTPMCFIKSSGTRRHRFRRTPLPLSWDSDNADWPRGVGPDPRCRRRRWRPRPFVVTILTPWPGPRPQQVPPPKTPLCLPHPISRRADSSRSSRSARSVAVNTPRRLPPATTPPAADHDFGQGTGYGGKKPTVACVETPIHAVHASRRFQPRLKPRVTVNSKGHFQPGELGVALASHVSAPRGDFLNLNVANALARGFTPKTAKGALPMAGHAKINGEVCHGVITMREKETSETLKSAVQWREGEIAFIRKLGKSAVAVITFVGRKVPQYVHYNSVVTRVREYKTIPACFCCGTIIGHRAELCPTPNGKRCGHCGQEVAPPRTAPTCLICGENHLTGFQACTGKFRRIQHVPPKSTKTAPRPAVKISDAERAVERRQQVAERQPARKKHHSSSSRQHGTRALLHPAAVISQLSEMAVEPRHPQTWRPEQR
ncbi:hypothetical protein HPB48_010612 [Haemaphysalis longicornis]|uniref:Uncharacterized protein n=1 Tax=Haemaphysalis longicornis TaxID=44386 RepID=A0A9J6FS43_HAELO|nr:hypothetical protein HPB48_010612 [Haemaphysalis longicornis]